MTEPR